MPDHVAAYVVPLLIVTPILGCVLMAARWAERRMELPIDALGERLCLALDKAHDERLRTSLMHRRAQRAEGELLRLRRKVEARTI